MWVNDIIVSLFYNPSPYQGRYENICLNQNRRNAMLHNMIFSRISFILTKRFHAASTIHLMLVYVCFEMTIVIYSTRVVVLLIYSQRVTVPKLRITIPEVFKICLAATMTWLFGLRNVSDITYW